MVQFNIPDAKKKRVLIDSDAKNEADDQFAIVQALLSEGFDLRGLIAAHFGGERPCQTLQESYDDYHDVLRRSDSQLYGSQKSANAQHQMGSVKG
ncbi:MAG: hypothetical protein NC123_02655 [Butyrivibrio sp.]|nr:hypothetical protein [Acetatifactor muris]MCM1558441.1 hypothetical protein [Butyrivibrio sp.]